MEVRLARNCCQRTAERQLDDWGWNYHELVPEKYPKCLDGWDKLTEFERGRYIGVLEQALSGEESE
jgi:hypothetical protein